MNLESTRKKSEEPEAYKPERCPGRSSHQTQRSTQNNQDRYGRQPRMSVIPRIPRTSTVQADGPPRVSQEEWSMSQSPMPMGLFGMKTVRRTVGTWLVFEPVDTESTKTRVGFKREAKLELLRVFFSPSSCMVKVCPLVS